MKKILLIGNGITKSLSPAMHNSAFAYHGLAGEFRYDVLDIPRNGFEAAIAGLRVDQDLAGFNVTIPFKSDIMRYLDEVEPFARNCGACNCVRVAGGRWQGFNTDGYGFIMPLVRRGISLEGRSALVVGAGGAARAAVLQCINNGIGRIAVVNRSAERAMALRDDVTKNSAFEPDNFIIYKYIELKKNELKCIISSGKDSRLEKLLEECEFVINATPAFAPGCEAPLDFSSGAVNKNHIFYDISYHGGSEGPFLAAAASAGALAIRGEEMLAYQGFMSFFKWTAKKTPIPVFMKAAGLI